MKKRHAVVAAIACSLLSAAAARAAPGTGPIQQSADPSDDKPPVELTQDAQVKDLCLNLETIERVATDSEPGAVERWRKSHAQAREQALGQSYRLEIPSKGFAFGRFRQDAEELELDGDRPVQALGGKLLLDLDGIDDVSFSATPDQLAAWNKLKKEGALRLAVVVRPTDERCAGSAAARAWRMGGSVKSWQLLGPQGILAAADSDGNPVVVPGAPPPPAAHSIRVEKITVDGEPLDAQGRLASAQAALDRCAAGVRGKGMMVVQFSLEGGRVREPQVILDALRDEAASSCVARALAGATVGGAQSGHGSATIALQ